MLAEQGEYRGVIQAGADDAFEGGVDLGEQSADAVADLGDLPGEVIIEAAEHRQFRDLLVRDGDGAERVGHRAGGVGDDRRVSGIGFRLSGVKVGDASHHQPRQIADARACGSGDGDGQGADGGWLVDDQQHRAMLREVSDDVAQPGFVLRQCPIQ